MPKGIGTAALILSAQWVLFATAAMQAQTPAEQFPDTASLMARVAERQLVIERALVEYTYTVKNSSYEYDNKGAVRSHHEDVYHLAPTAYEIFSLHVSHDGSAVPQSDIDRQMAEISKKLREDQRKGPPPKNLRPQGHFLFADVVANSVFHPTRHENVNGITTILFDFEPQPRAHRGSFEDRLVADARGKMWINPASAEIVRVEFTSVSGLGVGWGLLGSVKEFQGYVEQTQLPDGLCLPSRQEYTATGRELFSRFRIREVSEFSEYSKPGVDVFQDLHVKR